MLRADDYDFSFSPPRAADDLPATCAAERFQLIITHKRDRGLAAADVGALRANRLRCRCQRISPASMTPGALFDVASHF